MSLPTVGPISGSREGIRQKKMGTLGAAGCVGAFLSLFGLIGALFLAFFVQGLWQVVRARGWVEVPCRVISSELGTHSGDDSDTYSIEVTYRYRFDGRDYESSRYQFLRGASSGREGKARIVESLPAGGACVCYVDPENPAEAVLERGLTSMYWFAIIPLLFFLIGVGGVLGVTWGYRKSEAFHTPRKRSWLPIEPVPESMSVGGGGGVTLSPTRSPLGRFVGLLVTTLVWNGIVGIGAYHWLQGNARGGNDGCFTAFLVPFVFIGLALLFGSVPYSFLALFNPRPRLTLARASLPLGTETELAWRFSGWSGRISRLRISLEGREEATLRQGKSTATERSVFARLEVVDTTDTFRIGDGRATLAIPLDTMHTFAGDRIKVVWTLKLEGEIRHWPDVSEEVEITVVPSRGVW